MLPSDRVWMFNENTMRRGVWHIIEGDLKIVTIAESVYEHTSHSYRRHPKSCGGRRERVYSTADRGYSAPTKMVWYGCTCKLDTDEEEVITGEYLSRHVSPEHESIQRQPILCHQAELHGSGLVRRYMDYRRKHEDGAVVVTTDRVVPLHTYTGELPPGPTCSRCEAAAVKIESEHGQE